ncbi:hypothetical protein AC739_05530 [Planococcus glaciei]|uniref:hypothetical protein n=1 Tax=Planococcus glaciei TaxID=459472 RepID=UPI00069DE860|nr:hypothetical protein [Planococcus glaciei]KOF11301.1 hypothetical protein AC739_05530 [Planococcus glaciei]MBX0313950.1 hypothetical protein [Planococcus glaciei]
MGTVLSLLIVAVALFTAFALKKFYDKPYIVNFSLAAMLLLIVVRTLLLQPINTLGYVAIALCSIAFIFQAVLGIKNVKTQEQV